MKHWRLILGSLAGAAFLVALAACAWVYSLGRPPLGQDLETSHVVLDRDGRLLRAYATTEGRWRLPATAKDVDPRFLKLLFAYEDKRFYEHDGVDLLALGRAAFQLVTQGHIVSGGSTLTMQVARLLEPREHRSFDAKLRQITRALELEHALNKQQILALYLTLAPYGGNLEGIRAASLELFRQGAAQAVAGRSRALGGVAAVAGIAPAGSLSGGGAGGARPRARPRGGGRCGAARRGRARETSAGSARAQAACRCSRRMPPIRWSLPSPTAAFTGSPSTPACRRRCRIWRASARMRWARKISVAILAVDNETGEVRARVGSADYFDERRAGQVDMTQALRSPGSTLKPFIYGLAFEDGLLHPETLIDDKPVRYGNYTPENFDLTFQGTVTVRRALQMSLNVPAIAVLNKVGVSRLSARLTQTGAALVLPKGEAPGLAMGLGGVGIKLSDLVMLYTGLARQGAALPLLEREGADRAVRAPAARSGRRLVCRQYPDRRAAAGQCACPGASPSRPARPTAIAMPGRSASTAA